MNFEQLKTEIIQMALNYGPQLLGAILVLIVGLWIIKKLNKWLDGFMQKRDFNPSLKPFFTSLISISLKILLAVSVLGMVGIQMTSFIALLGAAGLAIGMALSGSLQNLAGGVIILLLKPFKVGDNIETGSYRGNVLAIQIFHTIIKTGDNKIIVIPNGNLSNSALINHFKEENRRLDLTFGFAYGESFETMKTALLEVANNNPLVLSDPAPTVQLSTLADSSVNCVLKSWVKSPDYWTVNFDLNEKVYQRLNELNIEIPFPQMDVHVKNS